MSFSLWKKISFWSEYGEICGNITPEIAGQISDEEKISLEDAQKKIEKELEKVNRVVIEAGKDLPEEDWLELATKAKELFGEETVLDIEIKKSLLGGARVAVNGNWVDNTVVSRYRKWRGYE